MITTEGKAYEQRGIIYVKTARPAVDHLSDDVTVLWHDSRMRTLEQIRKAFALMKDIGELQGQSAEDVYVEQRDRFSAEFMEFLNDKFFHLSTATVSEASAFINYLVNLVVAHGIQTSRPLSEMCENVEQMVYANAVCKKCCVCGLKAELNHVDAIGMGYDRRTKPQIGARMLPLCRKHHREYHDIGLTAFCNKYHIEPVRLDMRLAKVYKLSEEAQREGNYGQAV